MELKGKVAVVIGAATGIGAGLCRALTARGATVHMCDRDVAGAQALAEALRCNGAEAWAHDVDVVNEASLQAAESAIRAQRGRIDLVFANAGVISLKPFVETTAQDWQWIMGVNLVGCANSVRAFLPGLRRQETASRIVVTSSVAALRTPDMVGQTMYMASKSAQLGFCNALRTELAEGPVGLSVVFPGPVASKLREKSELSRPGAVKVDVPKAVIGASSMSPEEAGERIVRGVEREQPFITTHPGDGPLVREAQLAILTAFEED